MGCGCGSKSGGGGRTEYQATTRAGVTSTHATVAEARRALTLGGGGTWKAVRTVSKKI